MDEEPWGPCQDPEGTWYCFGGVHGLSCPAATEAERTAAAEKIAADVFQDLDLTEEN